MINLRPYKMEDADIILSWCKNEIDFYKWTAGVLGSYPLTVSQFNKVSSLMAFTATYDNEIIGFFTLRKPGETQDELRFGFVTVDSSKRGMGYGKAMLNLGIEYAREKYGVKKVSLGVFDNNMPAYYCYKSVGFQDCKLEKEEKYSVLGENWNCLELEMLFE